LELLKDAVPGLSQVALLANPNFSLTQRYLEEHRVAASSLGLRVEEVMAPQPDTISAAMSTISMDTGGLVVIPDALLFNERKRIAELALERRLPSLWWDAAGTEAGLLMSYGASFRAQFRRVAAYVDKILKGAKPADIPVEQPTQFEFIVNTKTAKALGLSIPSGLLARADEVIE
jgi:putative ABC transport system substrate-binding protein